MKTKQTPEQYIIDSFGGSRARHPVFKEWSEDAFIGYVIAAMFFANSVYDLDVPKWEKLVRELMSNGEI